MFDKLDQLRWGNLCVPGRLPEIQKSEIEIDIPFAQKIISDEVNIFEVWNESQHDNHIGVFAEKVEAIRLQLLDETKLQVSEEELLLIDK